MEREDAIATITSNVIAMCGASSVPEDDPEGTELYARIDAFSCQYYDMAAGFSGYSELPDAHLSIVTMAVLKAWRKRGSEANETFSGIGVSEKYVDIEEELRKNLKGMRNPLSSVVTADA